MRLSFCGLFIKYIKGNRFVRGLYYLYFLFPTTNEGMPSVVLEAMASGCKIICNTLLGITNTILDQSFLITDNNTDEFSDKMLNFCQANDCIQEVINKHMRTIKCQFTPEIVDKQIMDSITLRLEDC